MKKALVFVCVVLFALLCALTAFSFKVERYVEYRSGAMKDRVLLCGLEVFERNLPVNVFEAFPADRSIFPYKSDESWNQVSVSYFLLFYQKMPNFNGGKVANALLMIGKWFPYIEEEESIRIKSEFLSKLNDEGIESAVDFAHSIDFELGELKGVSVKRRD